MRKPAADRGTSELDVTGSERFLSVLLTAAIPMPGLDSKDQ